MMARVVRPIVSMRRRKLPPSSTPPATASTRITAEAKTKALSIACCMSTSRLASGATSTNEPSGRVRPKPVSLLRGLAGSSLSFWRTKSTTPSTGGMPGRLPTTTCCVGAWSR